jgi:hypothetical protein
MATLPTVPSFAFQEVPTITKLNQVATAVNFVTQIPIVISLKRSSTQAVAASTSVAVQWNVDEVDSDNMHSTVTNPSRLVSQTQGYYKMHATIAVSQTATAAYTSMWFQQTTGSNNPLGSGHTQIFGPSSFLSNTVTTDFRSCTLSCITPCLYVNDYIECYVFSAVACTLQFQYGSTAFLDSAGFPDGACCLYGYYLMEGP